MAPKNGMITEPSTQELPTVPEVEAVEETVEAVVVEESDEVIGADQDLEGLLTSLKALLSSLEKLQKVRQDVGDIKPLLVRMLDGELVSGEELEQLKSGVGGLLRLVRAYGDHQAALTKAQPARSLLDQVLKGSGSQSQESPPASS
jgi:hypothetical protein